MNKQNSTGSNEIQFCERWLSDGINKDYTKWYTKGEHGLVRSIYNVFIESPTGTGKTTFILEKLFPHAVENKSNILYLSNRTALKEQLAKNATEKYNIEYLDINGKEVINVCIDQLQYKMTLLNYQSFLSCINSLNVKFDYVILDEAHFFLEDALFNAMTSKILEKLLETFSRSTLIFMSATIREFTAAACQYLCNVKKELIPNDYLCMQNVQFYYNTYISAKYNAVLYKHSTELLSKINLSDRTEKWLIFVSSKALGNELKKDIQKLNRSVAFINSKSKKSKTWKEIVNNSCFSEDVLIATSVLDNGVNINDPRVKHIVLPLVIELSFSRC